MTLQAEATFMLSPLGCIKGKLKAYRVLYFLQRFKRGVLHSMKRFLISLLMLGFIYGCADDRMAKDQNKNPLPTTSGIVPTMPDPSTVQQKSPEAAPVADFTVTPGLTGTNDTVFTFDGSSSTGTIAKYKWNFGDQNYTKGMIVTHKFQYGGDYKVTLLAVSDTGEKNKISKMLKIDGPPGGGGGGEGTDGSCQLNDFRGNKFTVISVSGTTMTTDKSFRGCNACGEVRRAATGIREFVGDLTDLTSNRITLDYVDLPESTRPQPGENLYLVWKPLGERPNCTH